MDKIIKVIILIAIGAIVARLLGRKSGESVESESRSTEMAQTGDPASSPPVADMSGPVELPWIQPTEGNCPDSHPVKLKEASGIYHVAGQRNYERTIADRCYCNEEAAAADGYRASRV